MSLLNVKLLRDIWQSRWQFIAVIVVVMLGISFYQSSWMSYRNIGASYELYYDMLHFADFEITLKQAPDSIDRRLRQVPGITSVQPRIVSEVELEMPVADAKEVIARIISLPDSGRAAVNGVTVLHGRYLGPAHKREVLVERSFAEHHSLRVGDYVHPVVDGEVTDFRIVGLALSPEYLYAIQSKQYLMPTPSTFGVFWVRQGQAERLLGMSGMVNNVCGRGEEGQRDRVMTTAHAMLRRYGAEEPVPRKKQPSNYLLQMDLEGFKQNAVFFPLLFLFSASLTIYTLLVRIVNSQRGQIGFMRASGVSVKALTWHYLYYALLCGGMGGVLGVIAGIYMSLALTRYYLNFLAIPVIHNPMHWPTVVVGVAAGVLSCGIAGYFSSRRVALLDPAVALREEVATVGRRPLIERLLPVLGRLSFYWRIPLRNIFRNRRRTLYTAIGIAMGVSLILISLAIRDAMFDSIDTYIQQIQRYDLQASFIPPQTASIGFHVAQWPGVRKTETTLALPVELRRGKRVVNTVLVGLEPGSHLQALVSPEGRAVQVHGSAVLMSAANRKKLDAETGDVIRLAFALNDEDTNIEVPVRVGEIIRQPVGSHVYLPAATVRRIFERDLGLPKKSVTTLMVLAETDHLKMIKEKLYDVPNVAAVEDSRKTRGQLVEMMELNLGFIAIMITLGAGLALAIIYNTVSINIVERTRELASMRAMGMARRTVGVLITVENLLVGVLGLVGGIPLGYILNQVLVASWENETMQFEAVIFPASYFITIIAIVLTILLSQIPGIRQLNRVDLAAATKVTSG